MFVDLREDDDEDALPDDYEQCDECGFDHDYEYESACEAHEKIKLGLSPHDE